VQEQIIVALDAYAEGLKGNACQPPELISLTRLEQSFASSSTAVSETRKSAILNAAKNLVRQLSILPGWGVSEPLLTDLDMGHSYV
jgi:hypothetical protein